MATVNPVSDTGSGQYRKYMWNDIATGDTVIEQVIPVSGFYNLTVAGTFAGGTVAKLLAGPNSNPTKSLPVDSFGTEFFVTAPTPLMLIGPLAAGTVLKPSVGSGSGDSVDFTLSFAE